MSFPPSLLSNSVLLLLYMLVIHIQTHTHTYIYTVYIPPLTAMRTHNCFPLLLRLFFSVSGESTDWGKRKRRRSSHQRVGGGGGKKNDALCLSTGVFSPGESIGRKGGRGHSLGGDAARGDILLAFASRPFPHRDRSAKLLFRLEHTLCSFCQAIKFRTTWKIRLFYSTATNSSSSNNSNSSSSSFALSGTTTAATSAAPSGASETRVYFFSSLKNDN